MATPPLFSSFTAFSELAVTAVVVWFFWRALTMADYRFGIMAVALVFEAVVNITYMVSRLFAHEEGVTHVHDAWVTWFVGFHGALSLAMFLGLIGIVAWSWRQVRGGAPDPLGSRRPLAFAFLGLWGVSILTGELIYAFYWTDVIRDA